MVTVVGGHQRAKVYSFLITLLDEALNLWVGGV